MKTIKLLMEVILQHFLLSNETEENKNLSNIELGKKCEDILRDKYNLTDDEPLLIMIIDYNPTKLVTNQVEYKVYSLGKEELNISLCSNINVYSKVKLII